MRTTFYLLLIHVAFASYGQHVNWKMAMGVASEFFVQNNSRCTITSVEPYISSNGDTTFYVVQAEPHHYAIVSADQRVHPVLAWSNTTQFATQHFFANVLERDFNNRLAAFEQCNNEQKAIIAWQWTDLSDANTPVAKYQVWPANGSTSTEGWVETHWTQSAPYNQFCPMDPVTSVRSYTGCPATAMAQIVNYLKTTQNTRFDDADDYYHNYAGRKYFIDDDWDSLSFLSFPDLNTWLDSCDALFAQGTEATGASAAALTFACGTACVQVYTSSGSGTFSVNQAFNAYQRFGFNNAALFTTCDSTMYNALIQNMQDGFPAHLAVVDSAWSVGHNVVVDGYNTDGYFHINFGWGGSNDGWWQIPDAGFPYQMDVLEGVVVDIMPTSISISEMNHDSNITIWPNPATTVLNIGPDTEIQVKYSIYSNDGRCVKSGICTNSIIPVENLSAGSYMLVLFMHDKQFVRKFCK